MIMGIKSSGVKISADLIKTKLLQDIDLVDNVDNGEAALYSKKKYSNAKPNKGPKCYECNVFGRHIAKNSPKKKRS